MIDDEVDRATFQKALQEQGLSLRSLGGDEFAIGNGVVDLETMQLCSGCWPDPSVARELARNIREGLEAFYAGWR